jgi:hypothetical protein
MSKDEELQWHTELKKLALSKSPTHKYSELASGQHDFEDDDDEEEIGEPHKENS